MFNSLKLSDLPARSCQILREPTNTRPTIWVVEEEGKRAVIKDFSSSGFIFRNTAGRFLIWREARAYKKLEGIRGVPAFYGVIGGLALAVEEIKGINLEDLERRIHPLRLDPSLKDERVLKEAARFSPDLFKKLKDLVDDIHNKGIAHCDLKRTPNIMLGDDGQPYIIDWPSFMSQRSFSIFPLNLIYKRFLQDDYLAIIKLQVNNLPSSVSEEEKARYKHRSTPEKIIRAVRDFFRKLLQKMA
ncbi:MAG: hypothetical protein IME96_11570 [Proteobacteria bacterium]|nr:hypothetical protein [Pseudomonadota bacterium]